MPYVTPEKRERLDQYISAVPDVAPQTAGELGYILAIITDDYLTRVGALDISSPVLRIWRYQDLCDIIGTFESIKFELYRQAGTPYEDKAKLANGPCWQAALEAHGFTEE